MTSRTEPSLYFIDESGHSGDLASAKSLGFADQPVFALAAIGVHVPGRLEVELECLRRVHRCGPGELKSTMARLPEFVCDLAGVFETQGCSLFVELVDKRFFVAIHIVNHLLCGGLPVDAVPMMYRNAIAEFVRDGPAEQILQAYLDLCRTPSVAGVQRVLQQLWDWFDTSDEEIARIGQFLTMDARDRARDARGEPDAFLPIFDRTARGRRVWMLPNLQSLTNIYARINKSRRGGLNGAKLIHDEQLHYASILIDAKAQMEALSTRGALPVLPFADYDLRGRAEIEFRQSKDHPCLQAADLIAGCAMRFARTASGSDPGGKDFRMAFMRLLDLGNPFDGNGINYVFSQATLERMGLHTL